MIKFCGRCNRPYQEGELVEVVVIAQWHEIKSKVTYSLGKIFDTYPDTLEHHNCLQPMQMIEERHEED